MLTALYPTVNLFDTDPMRFARLLAAAVPCFFLACGSRSGGGSSLAYYETYDPRSLDPALSTDVPTGEMVSYVFDGLTAFDVNGKLLPGLADRWSAERGGQRYVFHLRPGVKFHDGRPLTAAAVRASFLRVLDPASTGGRAWPLYPIAGAQDYAARKASEVRGIQVLGDTAVAFDLTEPLAIFPKFLAMPVVSIVPSPAPADLAAHPVGTGPWRFVAWQHDDYLLFAKNPDYWGGAPLADTLSVRIIPEPLTQAAELEAGRLSAVEVPFGEGARWRAQHPTWLQGKPGLRVMYVALNNQRGPLADPRVRQAINYGVDVPAILRTVWDGRGILARGSIPPLLAGSDTARSGYAYDPARAKSLLAAAGYDRGFDVQLWRNSSNVVLGRVAQAVQADLAKVGIRVEIVERDASAQREAARSGKADMALLDWWADYPDADNFLFPLFHSGNFGPGGNYAFYRDPVTDSLILRARRTTDDAARTALYRQIDERAYRAAPWLYLWYPVDLWAKSPTIDGWEFPVISNGQRWTGVRRAAPAAP
jgi:peptide/nickel transport system substrate-binding protein